jgi:D-ribulokinase
MESSGGEPVWLGVDFGTSGVRAIVINAAEAIVAEQSVRFASEAQGRNPLHWQKTLFSLIQAIPSMWRSQLVSLAINGTSSTVLLCDGQGLPLLPPMLYCDQGDPAVLDHLRYLTPTGHCVRSISSSLTKLLTFQRQAVFQFARYFLHQADWLAHLLHGQLGYSDYHNSLKLGYDPATEVYPDWLEQPDFAAIYPLLPQVVPPGTVIGTILPGIADHLGIPPSCKVCAGTTDSIAAFLASPAVQPGDAVTSLGSTLVLKLLSTEWIDCEAYGIYSHRLGPLWLAGGASNSGGAVLAHFFTPEELQLLSRQINPAHRSSLPYYPLLKPGERFPINDPSLQPQLEPRPAHKVEFLYGLLEGLVQIEVQGYQLLQQLGASPLQRVFTAGGGAQNETWQFLRQRQLKVPVQPSPQVQAAYGTARLARRHDCLYCADIDLRNQSKPGPGI